MPRAPVQRQKETGAPSKVPCTRAGNIRRGSSSDRHRLNRGGDRQANAALWRIALVRLNCDQRTKDYLTKRVSDGKSKTEAIRCLKRYIAREVFSALPIPARA